MQVSKKKYRKGGFFGNSQAKFADMEGAGQGINMAYKSQGKFPGLGGQGAALRREKRYLKKLERQGKLNEEGPRSADRLDYLKKVQRDRIKKGVGAGALAAGAVLAAPAVAGALSGAGAGAAGAGAAGAAGSGASGVAGAAGAGKLAGLKTAIGKSGAADLFRGLKNKVKDKAPEMLEKAIANRLEGGADSVDQSLRTSDINPGLDRALQAGLDDPDMGYGDERIDDNAFNEMEMVDPSGGNTLMDRVALGDYGVEVPSGRLRQSFNDRRRPNMDMSQLFDLLQSYQRGEQGMKILKGGQKKLDKNNDGRITAEDFKLLQAMKAMYGAKLPR